MSGKGENSKQRNKTPSYKHRHVLLTGIQRVTPHKMTLDPLLTQNDVFLPHLTLLPLIVKPGMLCKEQQTAGKVQ